MKYEIKKLAKNTLEIIITIPWSEVSEKYNEMIVEVVKNAEVKGFRKGKAPRSTVEKNLNKDVFYTEVQNSLITKFYAQIVKESNILPVVYPRVEVIGREENKEWIYKLTVCEAPLIDLKNYKDELGKENAKDKIWVPGKDEKKPQELDKNAKLTRNINRILEIVNVELGDLMVEEEMTKLLSELIEEIKKLGLSLDQYLASTRKSVESLRDEYRHRAENSIKMEFILSKIADVENISVSEEEIKTAIQEVKDEKLKEQLSKSNYELAAIIRRQKTLDFIALL
jgi:FKBP-type peptidyl-prolyl cis-trans isomerase (trigger factor)